MKIVIFVSSLRNPFVEAWYDFLTQITSNVCILTSSSATDVDDVPPRCLTSLFSTADSPHDWKESVEVFIGGKPDVLFYWWGLHSVGDKRPTTAWSEAHVSVCVDTFPNASRLGTEYRELLQASLRISSVDSLVVASPQMGASLLERIPRSNRAKVVCVPTPFLLKAHAQEKHQLQPRHELSICFVGRSDYLFSNIRNMEKDDLGRWFQQLMYEGARIVVQRPNSSWHRDFLANRGFDFYEPLDRNAVTDGRLADLVSRHSGHAAFYSVRRATIARRVANSLSTRFATALCSPAPIIVPSEAEFAGALFRRYPVGFCETSPGSIVETLKVRGEQMRDSWLERHHQWAGEQFVSAVSECWEAQI